MLPAQLAIVYHHWRANTESCTAAVLASPAGQEHTRYIAGTLATLQVGEAGACLRARGEGGQRLPLAVLESPCCISSYTQLRRPAFGCC